MTRKEMRNLAPGTKIEVSVVYDNSPERGPIRLATVQPGEGANDPWATHKISVTFDDDATGRWHSIAARDVVRVVTHA